MTVIGNYVIVKSRTVKASSFKIKKKIYISMGKKDIEKSIREDVLISFTLKENPHCLLAST